MKTKIPSLSYNAMFKAVIANNKYLISALVKVILDYYKLDIDVMNKELIIKNNELGINNFQDKNLICDYIIKVDDNTEVNIEINRAKYIGLSERNLTYSFKIYLEHFNTGDSYDEFNKYTFLQVNFNNFPNRNGKIINRYYMMDIDDPSNKLSNKFSILNIDIAKCKEMVYNKSDLDEISDLYTFGAIMSCIYLEDIKSILERGLMFMKDNEKEKLIDKIEDASSNKETLKAVRLENSLEDRFRYIEAMTRNVTKEETTKEVTKEVTNNIIKSMLKKNITYEDIAEITNTPIETIEKIAKEIHRN